MEAEPIPPSRATANRLATDHYGALLLSIVLSISATAIGSQAVWSRILITVLLASTVLFALWISNVSRLQFSILLVCLFFGVVLVIIEGIFLNLLPWLATILSIIFIIAAGSAIVRRLRTYQTINLQTILGAICIYLLMGLCFTNSYSLLGFFSSTPVLSPLDHAMPNDYLYFSFITMTTVGYGDLVPYSSIARDLALIEALSGQIYLVTIVALLVGNIGKAPMIRPQKPQNCDKEIN